MDLIELYKPAAKKYKLPSFEDLDREFDIVLIEPTLNFLKQIRKKIVERLEFGLDILEKILQPDTNSYADMYELTAFNEKEKDNVLHLYKSIMFLHRLSYEIDLDDGDNKEADFIKLAAKQWGAYKKQLAPIVQKLKQSWKTEAEDESSLSYLG